MFRPFSKRNTKDSGRALIYDELPEALKAQIMMLWDGLVRDITDFFFKRDYDIFYGKAAQMVRDELGAFTLSQGSQTAREELGTYFFNEPEATKCLDVIEIVFHCFWEIPRNDWQSTNFHMADKIRKAVDVMNARFKEHRMGYEFRDGGFIRVDSQFLHAEAVEPALEVLSEPYLKGANQEFARAQEHYRHGRYSEAMNEALKAFESTMKAICHKRQWAYNQTDSAKRLLDVCKANGLFPSHMENSLGGLRSALEAVPTVRNKLSGHGQGVQEIKVDQDTASFALNSTAANIRFLAACEKRLN